MGERQEDIKGVGEQMKMRKEKRRMGWEGVGETESIGKKEDEYRLTWSRSVSLARPWQITSRKIKGVRGSTFTVSRPSSTCTPAKGAIMKIRVVSKPEKLVASHA